MLVRNDAQFEEVALKAACSVNNVAGSTLLRELEMHGTFVVYATKSSGAE